VVRGRDVESPNQLGVMNLGFGIGRVWDLGVSHALEVPTSGDKSSSPILCPVVLKSSTRTLLPAPPPSPATSAVLSNQAVALFKLSTVCAPAREYTRKKPRKRIPSGRRYHQIGASVQLMSFCACVPYHAVQQHPRGAPRLDRDINNISMHEWIKCVPGDPDKSTISSFMGWTSAHHLTVEQNPRRPLWPLKRLRPPRPPRPPQSLLLDPPTEEAPLCQGRFRTLESGALTSPVQAGARWGRGARSGKVSSEGEGESGVVVLVLGGEGEGVGAGEGWRDEEWAGAMRGHLTATQEWADGRGGMVDG
jgi:hypothetical protein